MKPFLLMGLMVLLVVEATTAGSVTCAICRKPARDGIKQDGKFYHDACFRHARPCVRCQSPITSSGAQRHGESQWIHRSCFKEARKCGSCSKAIVSGRYLQAEGGDSFHKSCYEAAIKCGVCNVPVDPSKAVAAQTEFFHQTCHRDALKCHICTLPIRGVFYRDFYDRPACAGHQGPHKCNVCQSPAVAWTLADGRRHCDYCEKQAVYDGPLVKPTVLLLKGYLARKGLRIKNRIHIELLGREALSAKRGGEGHPLLVGLFTIVPEPARRSERRTISLLYGMPKPQFEAVIVHELTHAWQAEACVPDQSLEVKEGVAELMSWLYLSRNGPNPWTETVEHKTVEPYRTGFEKARTLYFQLGHDGFMEKVRRIKHFP